MRVTVFGAAGMLGTEVCTELVRRGHSVVACTHEQGNVFDYKFVCLVTQEADAVINCAGMTNFHGMPSDMIRANSVGPWVIAQNFSGPVLHVSTDCVFNGMVANRINFTSDNPTPLDLYGRSKLLGECKFANVTNVRTSFIGFRHGLLRWLINNKDGEVNGRINCFWSGSTVQAVAEGLVGTLTLNSRRNIEHLATERSMNKYDVLVFINDLLKLNIKIRPVEEPRINRALRATIVIPSIKERGADLSGRYYGSNTSGAIREQSPLVVGSSRISGEPNGQAESNSLN